MSKKEKQMTDDEIKSLREWLTHWGDGPNWASPTGESVAIAKITVTKLLDAAERQQAALRKVRQYVLDCSRHMNPAHCASLALIAEDALEGVDE